MRKVLFEKYEPFYDVLSIIRDINKRGVLANDTILFCSKDLLIYRLNSDFKVKPNSRKQYILPCSKITGICVYEVPSILKYNSEIRNRINCISLGRIESNIFSESKCSMFSTFSNDNMLGYYQPSKFINENEEQIVNLILNCNLSLKKTFKTINSLKEPNIKDVINLIKQHSDVYKFYRKKIDTNFIMSEKKRISKENRLFSCKKFSHSRMSSN